MKALIRVQAKYRPVSGDIQGMRLQATIPNLAARKMVKTRNGFAATEQQVPAFRKPYLIEESGDANWFSESDLERFKAKLRWAGYSEFEMLTHLDGTKIEAALPTAVQARVDQMQAQLRAAEDAPF